IVSPVSADWPARPCPIGRRISVAVRWATRAQSSFFFPLTMYTVQRSASTACEQRSTRPRRYASRSFWTARWPSLTRTSATLSSSTAISPHDHPTYGHVGRGRGLRTGDIAEPVDLPARHRLDAPLHRHRTEVHGLAVVAELRQRPPGDDHLVASGDVRRGEPRRDVGTVADDRVLHTSF